MNQNYEKITKDSGLSEMIIEKLAAAKETPAALSAGNGSFPDIPGGDMPGDKIHINEKAIEAAENLFSPITKKLSSAIKDNPFGRAVLSVSGGSGSGKTCLSALTAYFLNRAGIGAYVMSGDNYVHRIPFENDAERLRIFRQNGVRAMADSDLISPEIFEKLRAFQTKENETGHAELISEPWFEKYMEGGCKALSRHLGSPSEQNFSEINDIISAFKDGAKHIFFRRMGRDNTAFWYEKLDMTNISVLILEWTHGLSAHLSGIDLRTFIHTTPEETYASRISRSRDDNARSDFIQKVIELEQEQLMAAVPSADIIATRAGKLITPEEWKNIADKGEK